VVVGDHHVDVARLLLGALGEAALEEGAALLPGAVLTGGRDQVPDVVACAGWRVQAAARLGVDRPSDHLERRLLLGGGGQLGRGDQGVGLGQAHVVGAAHDQRGGRLEDAGEPREVAVDQLRLEGFGGGGHDGAPAGGDDGHQVAQ
jgi:hypothetical protein